MKRSEYFGLLVLLSLALVVGCTPAAAQLPATATEDSPPTPVVVATATTAPVQAEDAGPWKVVLRTSVSHVTTIAGFLDESFGITAGPSGEIHYTTDGGKTWPQAENTSWCRFGLDIVDEQVAWHCGNAGHVRVSTDGGQTWQAVANYGPSEPNQCRLLSFLDAKTGWAATPYQLGATTDGGATWADIALPEGIQDVVAISLLTADEGYLLDKAGILYVTQGGGASWSSRTLGLNAKITTLPSTPAAVMHFFDADHGLVVFDPFGGGNLVAMRTADGGQTWNQESVPAQPGTLYLSHDGAFLTITTITATGRDITVLRYRKP